MNNKATTIEVDDLEEFDKRAVEMCAMWWKAEAPDGDPLPHVLIEDHFGKLHVLALDPGFFASGEEKDRLAMMVREHIARHFGHRVAFMCAAWTVKATEETKDEALEVMPSEHPDRVETAFVQILEPGGIDKFYSSEVERSEKEPPLLTGWTKMDGQTGGRFHDTWSPILDTAKAMYETGLETFTEEDPEKREELMRFHAGQVMDRIAGTEHREHMVPLNVPEADA